MARSDDFYLAAERRIELLTAGLGGGASILAAIRWGWRMALGVALGAALAWINFRWLKQGVAAMTQLAAAQAGAPAVRIPKRVYVKFFGRFALLILIVYAILSRSWLPAAALLAGLFALVGAVLVELVYELVRAEPPGDGAGSGS